MKIKKPITFKEYRNPYSKAQREIILRVIAGANAINENHRRYAPESIVLLSSQLARIMEQTVDLDHFDDSDDFLPVNNNMRIYQPPTQRANRIIASIDPIDDVLSGGLPMAALNVFMGISSRSRMEDTLEDLMPINSDD